jgi:Peptidase A4 family
MKNMSYTLIVMLLLAAPLASKAQGRNANELPTNLPGASTFAAPPEGFSVLTASDEQLADYGFPPRPDPAGSPKEYATWAKAMLASRRRIVPSLQQTSIFHGLARLRQTGKSTEENTLQSYNWSGYVDFTGGTRFAPSSFSTIATVVVVPTANEAFGACSDVADYASSWVGFDGANSNDVLQAGIEFDAVCFEGVTATLYSPWFEWYPSSEIRITNLPIAPGDDYFVEVWNTSATQAYAYLVNENANQAVIIGFNPPSGTKLVGNSAEWITEAPNSNGATATLTNYIADPFWNAYGVTHNNRPFDPGSSEAIIMLDNNNLEISYPTLLGDSAFVVQNINTTE